MFVYAAYATHAPLQYTGILTYRTVLSGRRAIIPTIEIGTSGVLFVGNAPPAYGYRLADLMPFMQDNDFTIKSVNGRVEVSIVIRGRNGFPVAEISRNHWKVAHPPDAWDFNCNSSALEVKDDKGRVVLQTELLSDRVRLQAIWYRSNGDRVYVIQSNGIQRPRNYALFKFDRPTFQDDIDPKLVIEPMFQYPSDLHPGELLSGAK